MMRHDDVGSKMRKAVFSIAFAVLLGPGAHITLEGKQAAVGSYYKAVFAVSHGCAGSATIKIRVQIPEGVVGVKPMPKTGWNLETVKGKYAGEYQFHGSKLSEGVKEVAWSGGKLADDNFDEFVISAFLTDTLKPNTTLYFPVVQECTMVARDYCNTQPLLRSVLLECSLALGILAVVAGWRFTPPPRVQVTTAEAPLTVHIHTDAAMFQVLISPGRVGSDSFVLQLMNGDASPLAAKEATLTLACPRKASSRSSAAPRSIATATGMCAMCRCHFPAAGICGSMLW